jgi:hypothetical protein
VGVPDALSTESAILRFKAHLTPASAAWWVSLAIADKGDDTIWWIFQEAHSSVRVVLNPFQSMD